MPDYYDYGSLLDLERPTVVTGYLSDFTRAVVYRASALLGVPYHDVDRMVEHDAGMDISRLAVEHGVARYREVESRSLGRALEQKPAGLIALGDGGLLDAESGTRVEAQARLIVLDFEIANLYWRVLHRVQEPETRPWHPLYQIAPGALADLRPFFLERRSGFEKADFTISASSLSVAGACEALVACVRR